MNLTPQDVEQKAFTQALRGYHMDEVDDFLDDVVETLRSYEQRLRDAQERITGLEGQVSARGDEERAISRALLAAQKSADDMLDEAKEEAKQIKEHAKIEAAEYQAMRDAEKAAALAEIESIRGEVNLLREKARSILTGVEERLTEAEEAAGTSAGAVTAATEDPAETDDADVEAEEEGEPDDGEVMPETDVGTAASEEDATAARPWERG
ncbi:MAG TPA: DivIVA domain-containing protein [Acidimicrobiia bacterium]|jgi:cell division initiation protein